MKNIFSLRVFKSYLSILLLSSCVHLEPLHAQSYDLDKSSAYLKSACYKRFAARDYTNSLNCTEDFAKRDDVVAEYYLGLIYYKGKGVNVDFKKAYKSFLRAADRGYAPAQNSLGVMFDNGQGVIQNFRTAFSWYLKAASRGHVVAQYNIGNMFYKGRGVIHDYKQAYIWFLIAASNGHKEAIQLRDSLAVTLLPKQLEAAQDEAKLIADAIDDGSILNKTALAKEPEILDPKAKPAAEPLVIQSQSKTTSPVIAPVVTQSQTKTVSPMAKPASTESQTKAVNPVTKPNPAQSQTKAPTPATKSALTQPQNKAASPATKSAAKL